MISVERTDDGYRATDAATQTTVVGGRFTSTPSGPHLPRGVDETVHATATRMEFPPGFTVVEDLETDSSRELGRDVGPIELETGSYCIRVNAPVMTYLRFDGTATIRKPHHSEVIVAFPTETAVTLGFRSRIKMPRGEIHVPRTLDGVATALTAMSTCHRTETPDRSFPTMREHPPEVLYTDPDTDETHIPPGHAVSTESSESTTDRIELVVPRELPYLVTGAPLVQYLGARIRLRDDCRPAIIARDRHDLPTFPDYPRAVGDLLQRIFNLDCVFRNAGPHGTTLAEASVLGELEVDPTQVYEQPMADRLETYVSLPYEDVEAVFPEWHLTMYVEPTFETVRALPYVVSNVPQVFPPASEPLESDEWLKRSLGDFYRGVRESVSVDLLRPQLQDGRTHGWMADGASIDVYKATLSGYQNRTRYLGRTDDALSIVAIVNDTDMGFEASEAADSYRDRVTELQVDASVTVQEQLSRDELADVFEADNDMVHFVGHCEPDGLVCTDGNLPASRIAESNAETFFLNACGSYYAGLELVSRGSVAGAITYNRVLDNNAALVGTAFARLLAHGFSIERAMDLSRRRVMAGKNYAVVGDGTHTLIQAEENVTAHLRIDEREDGRFDVVHDVNMPYERGAVYQSHLQTDDTSHLHGTAQAFVVDHDRLSEFLGYGITPVIFDGDLTWSDELRSEL